LTPDEVKALIQCCSTRAASGIRNRALIVTLYRAGLRVSEALAILPKDLAGTIRVLHGKGTVAGWQRNLGVFCESRGSVATAHSSRPADAMKGR
jgi:site-specific recombinase XerD